MLRAVRQGQGSWGAQSRLRALWWETQVVREADLVPRLSRPGWRRGAKGLTRPGRSASPDSRQADMGLGVRVNAGQRVGLGSARHGCGLRWGQGSEGKITVRRTESALGTREKQGGYLTSKEGPRSEVRGQGMEEGQQGRGLGEAGHQSAAEAERNPHPKSWGKGLERSSMGSPPSRPQPRPRASGTGPTFLLV